MGNYPTHSVKFTIKLCAYKKGILVDFKMNFYGTPVQYYV